MMTFEFANPVYYLGDRSQPWDLPASLAALEAQIDALIDQSTQSGSVVAKTLNMAAKIGVPGQVLGETVEIVVEADGNTITIKDQAGFVLEQVLEATGSAVLPYVFSAGALVLGSNPPGWLAVTLVITGEVLYSVFLEDTVEQLIEEVTNTVDAEFRLVSASGDVLGGVWYRDGLQDTQTLVLANAIYDLLERNEDGFPLAQEGMKIEYLYGNTLQEAFTVHNGQIIEDLAELYDVSVADFIGTDVGKPAFWDSGSAELDFNLYYSHNGRSWVFARDTDLLKDK